MDQNPAERSADIDLSFFDLNTVSEQELAAVPWIGEDRARALIQHRPFGHMDEVRRLPGFSEDIIDQLVRGGATIGKSSQQRRAA